MASTGDVTVAKDDGQGNVKIHPYLITMVFYNKVPKHITDLPDNKFEDYVDLVLLPKGYYRVDHYVNDSDVWKCFHLPRWCVSCLWSTATVLLHRLMRAQVPQIAAPKTLRAAGTDHLHPEPKVECVVLHEPASPTLDVIFVHGLYGSLNNTWRQGDWRTKYKIDPNVVPLRNHKSKHSCDCHKLQAKSEMKETNSDNESNCKINEDIIIYDSKKVSAVDNVNERLQRILPNESSLITENFYNNFLIDDGDVSDNYKTQAKFVQDLFDRSKIYDEHKYDRDVKYKNNLNECKCKINERICDVGCGCVCDGCYSTCWPKDWIKMDFPGARVISINYTSDPYLWRPLWVKGNTRLRLHERAELMISQLLELGVGKRPVIWVGHSKGGLFIKQIYCEAFEAHLKLSKMNNKEIVNLNNNKPSSINVTNKYTINNKYIIDVNKNQLINNKNIKIIKDLNKDVLLKINTKKYDFRINFAYDNVNKYEQNTYILKTNDEILNIHNCNINKGGFNKTFDIIRMDYDDNNMSENGEEVYDGKEMVERNVLVEEKVLEEDKSENVEDVEVLKAKACLWRYSAGFMFYSVPHRGSPLADIKTPITSRSIELLEISKDCPLVLSLQDRWLMASSPSKPVVRSLVETCRTLMSVLWLRIVSVDSADAGIGELSGVSVDHREICKPSSRSCLLYTQLTDLIRTALNKCQCH